MSDDDDIFRQCRTLYAQANMFVRKCNMCSDNLKMSLDDVFRAYCTPLYTDPFGVKKSSMQRLQVAHNDCFSILLKKPR